MKLMEFDCFSRAALPSHDNVCLTSKEKLKIGEQCEKLRQIVLFFSNAHPVMSSQLNLFHCYSVLTAEMYELNL